MRQWRLPADGSSPEAFVLEEVPAPEPGPGQVRIRVGALSINARDQLILDGPFGRTPGESLVPLSDVAGRVDAVGDGVRGWSEGDRVMTAHVPTWVDGPAPLFGPGPGSLDDPGVAAEYVVVDAGRLLSAPAHLDDAEASTLQVAGVTAWNSLFAAHPVATGDRVVVIGSGGVSLYAAQLALTSGAEVVAAVRDSTRAEDPRWADLGVAEVVTTEPGWGQRLHDSTGGIRKVVDTVGTGLLADCLAALDGSGEVAVPGLAQTEPVPVDVLAMIGKQASLRGIAVGSVRMHRDLAAFMVAHDLHPVVETRLPFDRLPDAYRALAAPGIFGKVLIEVG